MNKLPPLIALASGRKVRARRMAMARPKESKLHVDVANTLRDHKLPDWKWRHLNNKAKDAREGAILKKMGVNPDWFDFIIVSPLGIAHFLETKRVGEKLTPGQEEFRMWCIRCGIPHVVASTIDQVLTALVEWRCVRFELPKRGGAQ